MVAIACETVSFTGKGSFRCRHCRQVDDLPDGLSGLLLMLPDEVVLFDSTTGVILHECRTHVSPASGDSEADSPRPAVKQTLGRIADGLTF